jgi:hypothetical protein
MRCGAKHSCRSTRVLLRCEAPILKVVSYAYKVVILYRDGLKNGKSENSRLNVRWKYRHRTYIIRSLIFRMRSCLLKNNTTDKFLWTVFLYFKIKQKLDEISAKSRMPITERKENKVRKIFSFCRAICERTTSRTEDQRIDDIDSVLMFSSWVSTNILRLSILETIPISNDNY